MKLISYNVRGLSGIVKKREIQSLLPKHKPTILCIQETSMKVIKRKICCLVWGSNDFDFLFKPSKGRSGGILTI